MRKKVICFDLDDTLYKEKSFLFSGYRVIARYITHDESKQLSLFHHMCKLWRDGKNVFEIIVREYPEIISKAEMLKIYREHIPSIQLDEDVAELLNMLTNEGCILGLITDGRSGSQRKKIKALGLDHWFDNENIIISEEFGSEKPNEKNYLFFEAKYPGCRYYYVGDNAAKDFVAPNILGWDTIGVDDWMGQNIHQCDMRSVEEEYRPQFIVNDIGQVYNCVFPSPENIFIVPIFKEANVHKSQVGTGVIIEDYLVTASHVFHKDDYKELTYIFDKMEFKLMLSDAIFDGTVMEKRIGFSTDLLIFKVPHKESPFVLNESNIEKSAIYHARAYYYDDCCEGKLRTVLMDGIKVIEEKSEMKNCLSVRSQYGQLFYPGNSGCPIFKDNVIYGTLWREQKVEDESQGYYRYLFVDAQYIANIIMLVASGLDRNDS